MPRITRATSRTVKAIDRTNQTTAIRPNAPNPGPSMTIADFPSPYCGWAMTMIRISVMSSIAQRSPSRPRPESLTPP